MTKRRMIIAGNWKMNTTRESAEKLARAVVGHVGSVTEVEIVVCPPFPYLRAVHDSVSGSSLAIGSQNVYFETSGAFTGEISPAMLTDCGCKFAIIGHSERRQLLGESDELINRKVKTTLAESIQPILCVGETLSERQANQTEEVVGNQLRYALLGVSIEQFRQIVVAYEPVWAIGTGHTATPQQAEQVHAHLRSMLTRLCGADLAQSIPILYGGSVKADNAEALLGQPNVDGALVGGASLKPDDFAGIVQAAVRVLPAKV